MSGTPIPQSVPPALLSFTAYGIPQPAGSKKAFAHRTTGRIVVVDDAKGSRGWKSVVTDAALNALPEGSPLLTCPVALTLLFYVPRPKSHYGSGRNADHVKASSPCYPVVKPDCSKLVRAVEDAMTGIVYRDDVQIVFLTAVKRYGSPARCEVTVREVESCL